MPDKPLELRRPLLLVQVARRGLRQHLRWRDVPRLLRTPDVPEDTLDRLMTAEAEQEQMRREGSTGYSVSRHVDLLTAIIDEARR